MAKRAIGVMIMLLGLVLVLTPWYLFPVCGKGRYAPKPPAVFQPHKCYNTLKAETALGILTIGIGGIALLWPRRNVLFVCSAALIIISSLVALFPLELTGLCKVPTMPCRVGTLPALMILSVLMALTAIAGTIQGRSLR